MLKAEELVTLKLGVVSGQHLVHCLRQLLGFLKFVICVFYLRGFASFGVCGCHFYTKVVEEPQKYFGVSFGLANVDEEPVDEHRNSLDVCDHIIKRLLLEPERRNCTELLCFQKGSQLLKDLQCCQHGWLQLGYYFVSHLFKVSLTVFI